MNSNNNNCYSAKILADSLNVVNGKRLTTFEITYPRFVHAELMTHRMFSRNSASSRAIPNEKLIDRVMTNPALPVWWGKNQAGMQAPEELDDTPIQEYSLEGMPDGFGPSIKKRVQDLWLEWRDKSVEMSKNLAYLGLHKQLCNRLIEPWMPITVIVSATEYANWFHLRCHKDAQPEIREIAVMMRDLYKANQPKHLFTGEWHRPLVFGQDYDEVATMVQDHKDRDYYYDETLNKVSVGRCARVSYLTHDGKRELVKDVELCEKLSQNGHWSPFEHVAQAVEKEDQIGNFFGWKQYRKFFKEENYTGEI